MKKSILIILDGWGKAAKSKSNIIETANTPFIDSIKNSDKWCQSILHTSGQAVGLPVGQMGNSEVGHLNIGAGRVVYQDLVRITKACKDNSISDNKVLLDAISYAKENNKKIHFLGLVSDGGVHASTKHLTKLCDITNAHDINTYIHVLTDGRDTDPYSGAEFVKELNDYISGSKAKIATVCGRYYTMDRDNRWERIKKGYDLLVNAEGEHFECPVDAIKKSYENKISDEFINPIVITENNKPIAKVEDGDVMICFNFRTDRLREITTALSQKDMPEHNMHTLKLNYNTMAVYDDNFKDVKVLFDKQVVKNTLGEVIETNKLKQIRIAETEKYPHVTFFFSGGREKEFVGEKRIVIPSPKVATYDLQPEMSAYKVKDAIVKELNEESADFICLNFANGDMVGHTGIYQAIEKAVQTVDACLKEVVEAAIENGYEIIVTADHGNAENAINLDGSPNTAHTTNPVPIYVYSTKNISIKEGNLSNIAPTLLKLMELDIPIEMTADHLIKE